MSPVRSLAARLPKAELHVHIEGTLEPEMLIAFARRNAVDIPFTTVEAVRNAYDFSDLQDFLDIYYQGMSVLRTERDFFDLTMAYLRRAAADNVRHVEIFFDPQGHTSRGIPFDTVVHGIASALDEGNRTFNTTHRLIMCFLRHLDEDDAFKTLREAEPWLERIDGVGLDSSEIGNPPSRFARVFDAARGLGLRLVAHAGEEGPPAYVQEALDLLRIERLDHGNRALEDAALVTRLATSRMTLTVCPLSNLKLCVVKDLREHPIRKMLELGLRATINSDDPAYFGGYVNANFDAVIEALSLDEDDVRTLARNSFLGSFLPHADIVRRLSEIDALTL